MSDLRTGFLLQIGRAIDSAADKLPSGYQIRLDVENGGYGCSLIYPNGEEICIDSDSVSSSFDQGVRIACDDDFNKNAPENQDSDN